MCDSCGCGEKGHTHDHGPGGHHHHHHHDRDHDDADVIEVNQPILAKNDAFAVLNREFLKSRGVVCLNMISSPGSGKTALLEATLDALKGTLGCAVITGDQRTDCDAGRLANRGAPVVQIETGDACHLNAAQVAERLPSVVGADTRLLFIENVGNLVCPSAFDLGEQMKITLLSTPEGEEKPLKYPVPFQKAAAVVVTKTDLIDPLEWDQDCCQKNLDLITPSSQHLFLSVKSGDGIAEWIGFLGDLCD